MKPQKVALLAFLLAPLVVIVVLVYAISVSMKDPSIKKMPPVGAGAGDTGSNNSALRFGGPRPVAEEATTEPRMVEPESLEQGFVLIVEDKSGRAKQDSPIYLAGNINGWNPGDANYRLQAQSDMRWRIILPKPRLPAGQRMEFKFTRGTWKLEELREDMSKPSNRTLPMVDADALNEGEQPQIELVVPRWGDEAPDYEDDAPGTHRTMNVTGTVRRLQVQGGAATAAGGVRDLLVWLPPGYDEAKNASVMYPVLYMHDGQNLFEKHAGVPAEWKVDEIATDLITKHMMAPVIIVGIPHSGAGRMSEYLPVAALGDVKPEADRHVRWMQSEVMPRVERTFRVKTGPEYTGVGGSSLGAVISLHAATKHPEVFGIVLAESLPLRTMNAAAWESWLAGMSEWPRKIFLGVGGKELGPDPKNDAGNRGYLEAVQALDKRLEAAGLGPTRKLLVIDEQAVHNEEAWAKRLPRALTFLFPPAFDSTK